MDHRAVCFVIMPFGRKPDPSGRIVDFDRIYAAVIAPAVEAAGLAVVRADEEKGAGFIHKLMYERILLSEFAIADLTILLSLIHIFSTAQLGYLLSGIDWRMPQKTWRPKAAG